MTAPRELVGIQPLTLRDLQPFPLPKQLNSLPPAIVQQFSELYELIIGYIKGLENYKKFELTLVNRMNEQISTLNEIMKLFENYQNVSTTIVEQINKISTLFNEFVNLETYQYQLLSSNFNQELLKKKFIKLAEENNHESNQLVNDFRSTASGDQDTEEFSKFLKDFKASRKSYHLRKEKLNRWNEERVSGFI